MARNSTNSTRASLTLLTVSSNHRRRAEESDMANRLRDRSTGDLLVLVIAGTICFSVIATGAITAVYVFVNPGADISGPARLIADVINTLIGLLAGFLAGRTDSNITTLGKSRQSDAEPPHQ
jgi:fructose-specific phosphotransferase system IIC component